MTEVTAPFVRDRIVAPPLPPFPRSSTEDLSAVLAPLAPATRARSHARPLQWPLVDLVVAAGIVLGLQLVLPAFEPSTLAVALAWPAVLACAGSYTHRPVPEPLSRRGGRVLRAGAFLGLASWVAFPIVGSVAAPEVLAPTALALTMSTLVVRALLPGKVRTRLVVAGSLEHVQHAVTELATVSRYDIAAVCAPQPYTSIDGVPVHAGVADAVTIASMHSADAVLLLPGDDLPAAVLRRLQWQAARTGVHVYVGTGLLDVTTTRMSVVQGAGMDLLHVRPAPISGPRQGLKAVVERAVSLGAVLALLPFMLVVALMIRRDSPGPAIFRQTRVGRDGKPFTMYKFRTMVTSAEAVRESLEADNEADAVLFKLRADPRITGVGSWLRRYSVDELPQLWNVVRGEMSLVGPRPALPAEVDDYDIDPRRRLAVKPGLTGLWQVSGRSDLTWAESVRLDVRYVDNWSLGLDLDILRRTVGAVLGHHGAY